MIRVNTFQMEHGTEYSVTGLSVHDLNLLHQNVVPVQLRAKATLALYGPTLPALDMDLCRVYLKHGQTIRAIKHVRQETGCSLQEGKKFIDELRASMPADPDSIPF